MIAPNHRHHRPTLLGRVDYRDDHRAFGIARADRRAHVLIIGKTGTGKSTLLSTLVRQDIEAGEGLALLDPHGDLVDEIRRAVPEERREDIIAFDLPSGAQGLSFNPLANVAPAARSLAASNLLDVFRKLWADSWGPRVEHILRNALLCLLEQPEAALADILRLISDDEYRRDAARQTSNPQVRTFWLKEFHDYGSRLRADAIAPLQNKVGAFLADPLLYRILTGSDGCLNLRAVMDEGGVLLVNLAKGRIGADSAALFGSLLLTSLGAAAFERADVSEPTRRDFWIYVDEFQNFTTLSLALMLAELRKYRVGLVLAHQYLAQLSEPLQSAVFGNIGTLVCFRVGAEDTERLGVEFAPYLRPPDLVNLPNHHAYVRLMVDGQPSEPFSITTILPTDRSPGESA